MLPGTAVPGFHIPPLRGWHAVCSMLRWLPGSSSQILVDLNAAATGIVSRIEWIEISPFRG
jgi:hypothetical protein